MKIWTYYYSLYRLRALVIALAASLAESALLLPIMWLVRRAFDEVIPTRDMTQLTGIGVAIFTLYLANAGVSLYARVIALRITKSAIMRLRADLLERFYTFSRSFYSRIDLSRLHASVVQDTERLDTMSNYLVSQLIPAAVIGLMLTVVLALINWPLLLLTLFVTPLLVYMTGLLGKALKQRASAYRLASENFSKGVLFALQAMDLTRVQSAEDYELARQRALIDNLRSTSEEHIRFQTQYMLSQNIIFALCSVLILVAGGQAVGAGSMSVGELITFYVAFGLWNSSLKTIANAVPVLLLGYEGLVALHNLLVADDCPVYTGTHQIDFSGCVKLEAVSFGYGESPVLQNVHLEIRPSEIVLLMGPNGAGKSTIINLILGFYRPDSGTVYADGTAYTELDVSDLRRQIGVVMQDPIIFPGTIAENIAYGCVNHDTPQIKHAAELSGAHLFINQLPDGYDTEVGEDGMLLSGGQRQRIAIARALLGSPRLLILDEPTNHLDVEGMSHLINGLKAHASSILIISHHAALTQWADRVYTLNGDLRLASRALIDAV